VIAIIFFFGLICFYWSRPWGRLVKTAIVLVLLMEAAAFQNLLRENYPKVDPFFPDMVKVFTHVRPLLFDATRLDSPQDVRNPMMTMVQKSGRGCNYVGMFNTFDFDACHTDVRVDLASKAVLRTWSMSQDHEANYQRIAGCEGYPKYALLNALPLTPGEDIYKQALPLEAGAASFDADQVIFKVSSIPRSGWFYYADAFHPGWKALVNGVPTPLQRTADGFKALPINAQSTRLNSDFLI